MTPVLKSPEVLLCVESAVSVQIPHDLEHLRSLVDQDAPNACAILDESTGETTTCRGAEMVELRLSTVPPAAAPAGQRPRRTQAAKYV
mmetsp:Transcript_58212/g.155017  ORF Transcript_58212/g.155017 Transcript_58212/m.155017 type:complete len:88 (+) Transcript_58212:1177-1440(+)